MEYPKEAQEVLKIMKRTDFKNISKNEVISLASKLGELNPEVAKDIVAQFPEAVGMMNNAFSEYKEILEDIVKSDDESTNNYYKINEKGLDGAEKARADFKELASKVLDDYSKMVHDPDIGIDERLDILKREIEILALIDKHDNEVFNEKKHYENKAFEKDTEKKQFNWKTLGVASAVIITVVGAGIAAYTGGDFKIQLPNKD